MLRYAISAIFLITIFSSTTSAQTVFIDQGNDWTDELRNKYYTEDQGSRLMPLSWFRALKLADGKAFAYDSLARYGYLPMPDRAAADLPVGFSINGTGDITAVGMTCSACHTREIYVNGAAYRIDGGPAMVDFQSLMQDLDDVTQAILSSDANFQRFATDVLGDAPPDGAVAKLRSEFIVWTNRFHALMSGSLPDNHWGPGRLDALTMIFNRLGGLDIGPAEDDGIIAENIVEGDAPARYPFLWNAAKQDFTQWPGFLPNGNELLGLVRNLGEVYGVFADFRPHPRSGVYFNRDYLEQNSANWEGLQKMESWLHDMGPPVWPWALDQELASRGKVIFNLATESGGCAECHGRRKGEFRSIFHETLKTTVVSVGTDVAECKVMARTLKTGILEGASIPFVEKPLGPEAPAVKILGTTVGGAILQNSLSLLEDDVAKDVEGLFTGGKGDKHGFLARHKDLFTAFSRKSDSAGANGGACKYEGRFLEGIWAAAPYLHNGSVPTLMELLKKPQDRVASFKTGPNYDIEAVGLAIEQTMFDYVTNTTGCENVTSGNSRCGHDYGTDLSEEDKRALIEYLKSI